MVLVTNAVEDPTAVSPQSSNSNSLPRAVMIEPSNTTVTYCAVLTPQRLAMLHRKSALKKLLFRRTRQLWQKLDSFNPSRSMFSKF